MNINKFISKTFLLIFVTYIVIFGTFDSNVIYVVIFGIFGYNQIFSIIFGNI